MLTSRFTSGNGGRRWVITAVTLLAMAGIGGLASQAVAQDGEGGRNPRQRQMTDEQRAEFRDRMQARMEEMRANQRKQMQESLGANDEEFEALLPMIEKVQQFQRERMQLSRSFTPPGGGRRGGGRGGFSPEAFGIEMPELSAEAKTLEKAMDGLRAAVEDEASSSDKLKQQVNAVRAARAKLDAATDAAQKELRGVLMARQEAVLVISGILQ